MNRAPIPPKATHGRCQCGESRPETKARQGRWPCYECVCERGGKGRTEEHHPFGRNIPAFAKCTVETPGNWHRAFDDRRAKRPKNQKRPGDNPLHQIAAIVVTFGEAADVAADYARRQAWPEWVAKLGDVFSEAAQSAASWLLILADRLDEKHGPTWAEKLDMPPPWQR